MIRYSLLVPSYNRPDMIREAVLSLAANQAPDVEIVVADDASPRQAEIQQALADFIRNSQVRFLGHTQNGGWSRNRNSLVEAARGEWVILLGDDDRLKAGALARIRDWMAREPGADIYGFGYDIIDADGVFHYTRRSPRAMLYEVPRTKGWEELYFLDALSNWSHHPFTMCFRRELGLSLPYNPAMDIADDILFLFQALQRNQKFLVIPESLFEWRRVEKPIRGYISLSAENYRNWAANWRVWRHLTMDPATLAEIAALIRTPRFIRRFLRMTPAASTRLSNLSGGRGPDLKFLDDKPPGPEAFRAEGPIRRFGKILRVCQVLGHRHLYNLMIFYCQKAIYRATSGSAVSNSEIDGRLKQRAFEGTVSQALVAEAATQPSSKG